MSDVVVHLVDGNNKVICEYGGDMAKYIAGLSKDKPIYLGGALCEYVGCINAGTEHGDTDMLFYGRVADE